MPINKNKSSPKLASQAAGSLQNENSSKIKRKLAASVVAKTHTGKQTGAEMETIASDVMKSSKYSEETKSYAASLLSQSNKSR